MGVPQLIRHFANAYPSSVGLVPSGSNLCCDVLYVDFNGLVHQAAAHVQRNGHTSVDIEGAIIETALNRLTSLYERLQPRKLMYVAVDGVPPMAKMTQQRSRRFMSTRRNEDARVREEQGQDEDNNTVWDRNAITPGTVFMQRLGAELRNAERTRHWGGGGDRARIVASDASERGEGEQKIFRAIRQRGRHEALVYGLDADLALMALMLPSDIRDGVKVVREHEDDADCNGVLQIVRIKELGRGIVASMIGSGHPDDRGRRPFRDVPADGGEACLRDFVYLCNFVGNDFVPSLPGFRIRGGAIDVLVRAYRQAMAQSFPPLSPSPPLSQRSYLTAGGPDATGGVRLDLLAKVMRVVADREESSVASADGVFMSRKKTASQQQRHGASGGCQKKEYGDMPVHLLPHGADDTPAVPIFHTSEGWRLRYYRYIMGLGDYAAIRAACLAYLSGTVWSLCYFEQQCRSEGWWFEHAYAPCASDLCNLLAEGELALAAEVNGVLDSTDRAFRALAPLMNKSPCWTLLMVLPPSSTALIPDVRLRNLVTDAASGCGHLFPLEFRLASYLKERVWECAPLLPGLDPGLVLHHVSRVCER